MKRHPDDRPRFRVKRGSKRRGTSVALHAHNEAQLLFAASGTIQAYTASGCWLAPTQLAVWLPAGVPHRVDLLTDTEYRMIYWHPSAVLDWAPPQSLDRPFALRVTRLLRELILAAHDADATPEKTELVVRLILHQLTETPDAPTFLPLPESPIGRRVADLAITDPQMQFDIDHLASRAATSVRTISRLFPVETGLTFKAWRQRARIVLAMDQLSSGIALARVAADAGFASTAAFCFAFRQVTKMTTSDFLNQQRAA